MPDEPSVVPEMDHDGAFDQDEVVREETTVTTPPDGLAAHHR